MPKRDRNHELETESQRAFESAMPSNIIVRPISDDYGIDREVEVFLAGKTTGLTFKVQLKATDKSGVTRRIKRTSLNYWTSLDVPVLLVSYEAKTRVLRGRWVHSIGADGPDTGAETLTVHMDPNITVQDTWAARLANDLALIRAVRQGIVPVPTPVRVEIDGDLHLSSSQTTAALLNLSRRSRNPMTAAIASDDAALTVVLTSRRVHAALPLRIATFNLHLVDEVLDDSDPHAVAQLSLILCAGAVSAVDEDCARQWLLTADPAAPWWSLPELAERLSDVLAHRETIGLLLSIQAGLVESNDPAAEIYWVPIMNLIREVDQVAFETYSHRIRASMPEGWAGGLLAFNLSSLHRLRRDDLKALELLEVAASRFPGYLDDDLYNRYLGACQWQMGRYSDSARSYRRALELGLIPHTILPLLADSLLYDGQYEQARRTLDGWVSENTGSDKAGLIRIAILDHIVHRIGITEQDRTAHDPQELVDGYHAARDAGAVTTDSLLALLHDFDALHPLPWVHLASLDGQHVEFQAALIAAFLLTSHPIAWVLATIGALEADAEESLLRAIIDQARYLCGEAFYDAVLDFAVDQEEGHAEFLRELISAAYSPEPAALTNHLRTVDLSQAAWVIDTISYPAPARHGVE